MATPGYHTGLIVDDNRPNWAGSDSRPISWSAWYPTDAEAKATQPPAQFFDLGDVNWNAPIVSNGNLPVILLSHGTGGTAESLGWLARALAGEGFVVLGANHHGNTGVEPCQAEGFICWWERATDLTVLLSSLVTTGFFAGKLDMDRISAIGFSLGGHTVMALAGARTSMEEFEAWRTANNITQAGPKEFPDAADSIPTLMKTSDAFKSSWQRHGDDFTDPRISSILAIAPAPPIRAFIPQTVSSIKLPFTILTGAADKEAPSEQCADWVVGLNNQVVRRDLGKDVGHYTFVEFPEDKSLIGIVDIFTDRNGVDRHDIQKEAIGNVLKHLAQKHPQCFYSATKIGDSAYF